MRPKGLWTYAVISIIAGFFLNQQYEGLKYLEGSSPMLMHSVNFSFLIFFGIIGYIAVGKYRKPWLKKMWVIVYGIVIFSILLLGAIDLIYRFNNLNFRQFLRYFRLFFSSPIPFGIIAILMTLLKRIETAKQSIK